MKKITLLIAMITFSFANSQSIAGGYEYTLFTCGNGTVTATGDNSTGQLGNGTTTNTLTPMHLNSEADIFNSNKEFYDRIGAVSQADKFTAFILNERSRELMGELQRWEDLARTKTLIARTSAFNGEAKPQENKHYLRPIPQSYLDVIKINGAALSPAQKQAMQNPNW